MKFKDSQATIKKYWHLCYQPKLKGGFHEIMTELERRIEESVKYHLVSDVPVGAFLSGGMDSSLVVAMMSRLQDTPVKTFSGDIPYKSYSELPYARAVAEKYQTEHYEREITPSLLEQLPILVHHLDEPSDPLSICVYEIARLASQHVKVVLGGEGGDELFGGYDRYYGNVLVNYYQMLPEKLRAGFIAKLLAKMPDSFWYRSITHQLKWIQQMSFYNGPARYTRSLGYFYFSDAWQDDIFTENFQKIALFDPEENLRNYFESSNSDDLIDQMLYTDSMIRMPDHPVMIQDRMTMAHGLEARAPFLDHELAEFCASIPSRFKIWGRKLRYIQTRLSEKFLPHDVIHRKKQGFSSALPYVLDHEFKIIFKALLNHSRLAGAGYLKQDGISRMMADHFAKKADHGNRLWLLCNSEIWYRMYIEGETIENLNTL